MQNHLLGIAEHGERDPLFSMGFTIVELLVVVGIIALMIGMAIPAMNSLSRGNAVNSGASQLANTIRLARAKAITSRGHTRVVFSSGGSTNAQIVGKTSYAVLLLTNRPITVASNWTYVENWRELPKGAYFFMLPSTLLSNVPTNSAGTAAVSMYGIEFKSTGNLTSVFDEDIAVQEGTVINGSVVVSNAWNVLTNHIYATTGRTKILR